VRRLLTSLVPVVCPPHPPSPALTGAILAHSELSVASFGPLVRGALLSGALSYELAAPLWPGNRGRRASQLPPARASAYFAAWWHGRLALQRELARALKGLLCLAYYEQPAVQAALDYQPARWVRQVQRRRLSAHGSAIAAAREALLAPDPLPAGGPAALEAARTTRQIS
jgi:hypothetical protein